jgi:hypothetical protein
VIVTSATVVWWTITTTQLRGNPVTIVKFSVDHWIYARFVVIGSVATAFVRLLELPMTAKLDADSFSSRGIGYAMVNLPISSSPVG